MGGKDRALGMVEAVLYIFTAAILIKGFGFEINVGVLVGPLLIAGIHYWGYRRSSVTLVKDESVIVLSGNSKEVVQTFYEMGYRRKS